MKRIEVLIDEISREMCVDVAQDRVAFDEWRHAAAGSRHRISGIDGVAVSAGVTRKCPVANPAELAMVKVGNSACGLAKLTPLSRTAARAGAVSGVTDSGRKPSGTNKIRLRWLCARAGAEC